MTPEQESEATIQYDVQIPLNVGNVRGAAIMDCKLMVTGVSMSLPFKTQTSGAVSST